MCGTLRLDPFSFFFPRTVSSSSGSMVCSLSVLGTVGEHGLWLVTGALCAWRSAVSVAECAVRSDWPMFAVSSLRAGWSTVRAAECAVPSDWTLVACNEFKLWFQPTLSGGAGGLGNCFLCGLREEFLSRL